MLITHPRNSQKVACGDFMEKDVKKKYTIKESKTDYVYYAIAGVILFVLAVIVIYPLYFICIASISDPDAIFNGEVYLFPIGATIVGLHFFFKVCV